MERDKQIGLALAVLLMGTVGAFFFRNEPLVQNEPPELEQPHLLDRQIAEKPLIPYLSGIELERTAKPAPPEQRIHTNPSTDADPASIVQTIDEGRFRGTSPSQRATIDVVVPVSPQANSLSQSINDPWQAVDQSFRAQRQQQPSSSVPTKAPAMCRVEPGDTLSSLAARHLGDSERFLEIYDLNRDVLQGPNRLRVGTMLKLPGPAAPARNSFDGQSSESKRDHSEPIPLVPLQPVPSASGTDFGATNPGGRSLSQVLPPDYPGVEARSASVVRDVAPEPARRPVRLHTVQRGDTLVGIALLHYGDRNVVGKIFEANRHQLSSPDAIREGMTLVLP